jgi:hypothetical protein
VLAAFRTGVYGGVLYGRLRRGSGGTVTTHDSTGVYTIPVNYYVHIIRMPGGRACAVHSYQFPVCGFEGEEEKLTAEAQRAQRFGEKTSLVSSTRDFAGRKGRLLRNLRSRKHMAFESQDRKRG